MDCPSLLFFTYKNLPHRKIKSRASKFALDWRNYRKSYFKKIVFAECDHLLRFTGKSKKVSKVANCCVLGHDA